MTVGGGGWYMEGLAEVDGADSFDMLVDGIDWWCRLEVGMEPDEGGPE